MQQKLGECNQCHSNRPINSKGICPDCVFRNNHDGLSQQEYYYKKSLENNEKKLSVSKVYTKKKRLRNTKGKQARIGREKKREEQFLLDEQTYEEVFNSKPPFCEECGCRLPDQFRDEEGQIIMRSQYSHILGKKAYGEYRNQSWNLNRLCYLDHQKWDFGDKQSMKIYQSNKERVLKNTGRDIL